MLSKPLLLYLDTSVPSFLYSPDDLERQEVTKSFFEKVRNNKGYDLYISDITLREIGNTQDVEKRNAIKLSVSDIPILETDTEVIELANRYLKEELIPAKYRDDALHIAIASVNNIDTLVSWNFEHIVRLKTKRGVSGINTLLGYKVIGIIPPQE